MSSQTQRGIPLITPLFLRRGGVFRLCRGRVQAFEIPLQTARYYCSQINLLSLKIAFVTIKESIGYKEACKRCPFALQNMPFYTSKDALLHCKRASFTTQKGVDGKRKGKEIDKRRAELRKEKRPKYGLPKPLQRRGCAWRDTECCGLGI